MAPSVIYTPSTSTASAAYGMPPGGADKQLPARKLYIFKAIAGVGEYKSFHCINKPGLPIAEMPKFGKIGVSLNENNVLELPVVLHAQIAKVVDDLNRVDADVSTTGWLFVSGGIYPAVGDTNDYYAAVVEKSGPIVHLTTTMMDEDVTEDKERFFEEETTTKAASTIGCDTSDVWGSQAFSIPGWNAGEDMVEETTSKAASTHGYDAPDGWDMPQTSRDGWDDAEVKDDSESATNNGDGWQENEVKWADNYCSYCNCDEQCARDCLYYVDYDDEDGYTNEYDEEAGYPYGYVDWGNNNEYADSWMSTHDPDYENESVKTEEPQVGGWGCENCCKVKKESPRGFWSNW